MSNIFIERRVVQEAIDALGDLCCQHAPDYFCEHQVTEARLRIKKSNGTLAYVAEINTVLQSALTEPDIDGTFEKYDRIMGEAVKTIQALNIRIAGLEEDAARYRWLRAKLVTIGYAVTKELALDYSGDIDSQWDGFIGGVDGYVDEGMAEENASCLN